MEFRKFCIPTVLLVFGLVLDKNQKEIRPWKIGWFEHDSFDIDTYCYSEKDLMSIPMRIFSKAEQ